MEDEKAKDNTSVRREYMKEGELVAGRYRIAQLLGTGGMGSVYLAEDRILGAEKIALKVLHRQLAYDQKYTQRFLREVQIMRRINHPNVVRTFDVGTDGDLVYFSMEYVDGRSLISLMHSLQIPRDKVTTIITQVCEGLAAIHESNVVHRDLKPDNILVTSDWRCKIMDFGVARPQQSRLTAHNEVIGSAAYMAPELWLGEDISVATDLYSLGIMLFELYTNRLPFDGETPAQIMRQHIDQKPESARKYNPDIPAAHNRLIVRLLEKDKKDRPKDAREVIQFLESASTSSGGTEKDEDSARNSYSFLSALERQNKENPTEEQQKDSKAKKSKARVKKIKAVRKITATDNTGLSVFGKNLKSLALGLGIYSLLVFAGAYLLGYKFSLEQGDNLNLFKLSHSSKATSFEIQDFIINGIGPFIWTIFTLCLGAVLISMSQGAKNLLRISACFAAFFSLAALLLTMIHAMPVIKHGMLDGASLAFASQAVSTQLFQIATLQPFVTSFDAVVLSKGLVLKSVGQFPFWNSFLINILYLSFVATVVKMLKLPKPINLILGIEILALILVQSLLINPNSVTYTNLSPELSLLSFEVSWTYQQLMLALINWGIVSITLIMATFVRNKG